MQFVIPMKTLERILLLGFMALMVSMGVRAATMALDHPVITRSGMVAHRADKILRLEANCWRHPRHEVIAFLYEAMPRTMP